MPVTVAVGSLFRNSARTLDYFRALWRHQLGEGADFRLKFSFVEGDSTDDTWPRLRSWAAEDPRVTLSKLDVEPVLDFEDRIRKWACLGNAVIDQIADSDWDWFLWCESDLCLPPDLVTLLLASGKDVVAPAIHLGGFFYDTWGFRGRDGQRYRNVAPLHPGHVPFGLAPMDSVGSVVLFRRAILEAGVRFRGLHENGLLVGACQDARSLGFEVWMDSRVAVVHPTSLWQDQQYRLGRVEVETADADPEVEAAWRRAIDAVLAVEAPLLGSPVLPPDHPAFEPFRAAAARELPARPFSVRSELHSEAPKRYVLVITDRVPTPCEHTSIP